MPILKSICLLKAVIGKVLYCPTFCTYLTSSTKLLSFGAEPFVFSLLSKNLKIEIYRTIILSVVLYGCETWSLTLREERRLKVF
jgi:hypothetical protein